MLAFLFYKSYYLICDMSIPEEKKKKRRELRSLLAEIPNAHWERSSQELSSSLVDWLNADPEIKKVALFSSLPTEVTLELATQLLPNVEWHYPVVSGSELKFHLVSRKESLKAGFKDILEPNPQVHPPISSKDLDLIICPGLAFTQDGKRLGRGGGFYDRFLATVPDVIKLGVCLPEQIISDLPIDEHDIKVSHLLTKDGVKEVTPSHENLA